METIIPKVSCLFVTKCLDKKLSDNIFYNYFEKLHHSEETQQKNAILILLSDKLEVANYSFRLCLNKPVLVMANTYYKVYI